MSAGPAVYDEYYLIHDMLHLIVSHPVQVAQEQPELDFGAIYEYAYSQLQP